MFSNFLKGALNKITTMAESFSSQVLKTDELYAKHSIGVIAAVTMADGFADDGEMNAAFNFIETDDKIMSSFGNDRAQDCLAVEIERYTKILRTSDGKPLEEGQKLGAVAKKRLEGAAKLFAAEVPKKEDREMIIAIAEDMAGADGNVAQCEKDVIAIFRSAVV